MANIYSSGIKLNESQKNNIKENTSYIFSKMGIQVKSLLSGSPITTNLSVPVLGPFSYRTAQKFLNYKSGTEISKKSCDALIAFYNLYFEPQIYGTISDFATHNLAKEQARLKPKYRMPSTNPIINRYAEFFCGDYYCYMPSTTQSGKIRGGVLKIYEKHNQLQMILISRIHADAHMDQVMDIISQMHDMDRNGSESFHRNPKLINQKKSYLYRQGTISIDETNDSFHVLLNSEKPASFPMFLSLKNTSTSINSFYKEYYAGMGLSIVHSGDHSQMCSMKIAISKQKISLDNCQEELSYYLTKGISGTGTTHLTTGDVTEWLRFVESQEQ